MPKRLTKKFKRTVSSARGCTHAVRGTQQEYMAEQKSKVTVAETYCGRKRTVKVKLGFPDAVIIAGTVDCGSCIKAMAAEANR